MPDVSTVSQRRAGIGALWTPGVFWLLFMTVAALFLFQEALGELFVAWQLPEYSHGPLIPVLSILLFLRHLKVVPVQTAPVTDRDPGVALMLFALALGLAGKLIEIGDIVTYALILWVGAVLLICFGWRQGRQFWSPVLHLVYMLPLPGALYYGVSTYLQGVSSELGVFFLQLLQIPVFLEGNIIDLGIFKLHVAEACSGLRYMFPILSFSYIFAVIYRGPTWHKATLLVSAVPITILMNSVRIAVAGIIVNYFGLEHLEGFSHFFEGWVIFMLCIAALLVLAAVLLRLRPDRVKLRDALDLETDGLGEQAMRLRYVEPSRALVGSSLVIAVLAISWHIMPTREPVTVNRDPFTLFPRSIADWQAGPQRALDPQVEVILAADDYYSSTITKPSVNQPVDLFIAWYADQLSGGVHSPEVCLPGGGWEIAELNQINATDLSDAPFNLNRAVIQKGTSRMLVYYWFEQQGQRTASGFTAKMQLMTGKLTNGRQDSGLVRLTTPIDPNEGIDAAETRLNDAMQNVLIPLPRFISDV